MRDEGADRQPCRAPGRSNVAAPPCPCAHSSTDRGSQFFAEEPSPGIARSPERQ